MLDSVETLTAEWTKQYQRPLVALEGDHRIGDSQSRSHAVNQASLRPLATLQTLDAGIAINGHDQVIALLLALSEKMSVAGVEEIHHSIREPYNHL